MRFFKWFSLLSLALLLASCGGDGGGGGDFSLVPSSSTVSVAQGSNGTVTVTVVPQGNFNAPVALSLGQAPEGVTAEFNPPVVAANASSTVTITVANTVAPSDYPVIISGTAGNQLRSANLTLTVTQAVGDFSLVPSPTTVTVAQGSNGTVSVTVVPQGNFNAPVALSLGQAPEGVTAEFNPPVVAANASSTVTITVANTVAPGTYPIAINGTADNQVRAADLTLTVTQAGPGPGPGAISGTVTAPAGGDVNGTLVVACDDDDCPVAAVIETSGSSATYTISNVPAGQYH
jgi:hypothetical protein